jgi:hypothetical protein
VGVESAVDSSLSSLISLLPATLPIPGLAAGTLRTGLGLPLREMVGGGVIISSSSLTCFFRSRRVILAVLITGVLTAEGGVEDEPSVPSNMDNRPCVRVRYGAERSVGKGRSLPVLFFLVALSI